MSELGVHLERTVTGLAPRMPPVGWTWHHELQPGLMRLVRAPSTLHVVVLDYPASQRIRRVRRLGQMMDPARLIDVVSSLSSQDSELTIYATKPWRYDSLAVVAREPDEAGVPGEAASLGAEYFIEVFVAAEFLEGWLATSPRPRSDVDRCERLIQYAINDA